MPSRIAVEKQPYTCADCGETHEYIRIGFEASAFGGYRRKICACERNRERQREAAEVESKRLARVAYCEEHSHLVGKLSYMTLDGMEMVPGIKEAIRRAKQFIVKQDEGLILSGDNGCGKTTIAASIGNALVEKAVRVEFWTGFDLLDRIRRTYDDSSENETDIVEKLARLDLLIYDDLGNERIAHDDRGDWAREKLFRIFYWRDIYQRPVIITTNYTVPQLIEKVGKATMSRLLGMCGQPVKITAPDYRLRG